MKQETKVFLFRLVVFIFLFTFTIIILSAFENSVDEYALDEAKELCGRLDLDIFDYTSHSITCINNTSGEVINVR